MMETLLAEMTQQLLGDTETWINIYVSLAVAGIAFFVVSLLVGSVAAHADISHEVSVHMEAVGHEVGAGHPGETGADTSAEAPTTPEAHLGLIHFKGMLFLAITSWIAGAGAFGLFAIYGLTIPYQVAAIFSTVIAAVGGFFVSWGITFSLWKITVATEASSELATSFIIGSEATVITEVPTDGLGVVRATLRGELTSLSAKSATGETIPYGTIVRITRYIGGVALIAPIKKELEPLKGGSRQ